MISLIMALALGPTSSEALVSLEPQVQNPNWAAPPPTPAYPSLAFALEQDGRVVLQCAATPTGEIQECHVIEEAPSGMGFASAALMAVSYGYLHPRTVNGRAEPALIRVPFNFMMPEAETPPVYDGQEPDAEHLEAVRPLATRLYETMRPLLRAPLGSPPDRRERVNEMVAQAQAEQEARMIEALAVGIARAYTPDHLFMARTAILSGAAPWSLAMLQEAGPGASDRFIAVQRDVQTRVREMYCAEYDCEIQPEAP